MIKLNLFQKCALMVIVALAIALSCQKSDGEKTLKPEKEIVRGLFVPYDTPPTPVGGFREIQKNLAYPEAARKAGIEGKVIVHLQINAEGNVSEAKILKSLGSGCDEAAIDALKSVTWTPAQSDGKPVSVWVAIPVVFKLKVDAPSSR